jgi:hypothetical protein
VGFSYHLPSKSYAIFQFPSYTFSSQYSPPFAATSNTPSPPQVVVEDVPQIIQKFNPVLEADPFVFELEPTSFSMDVDTLQQDEENGIDVEVQRLPPSIHDPFLLHLPPLMSPEILHGNRVFPDIELQKVPSLGESNSMAIGRPMDISSNDDDVDLKFYDAVPQQIKASLLNNKISIENTTLDSLPDNKGEKLLRLRRRRRKKSFVKSTKIRINTASKCKKNPEMKRLNSRFPKCTKPLDKLCKSFKSRNHRKDIRLKSFGECLIMKYPKTKKLSKLSPKMLKSGRGTISFESDEDCTTFVHTFFLKCKSYITSCKNVREGDREQAKLVLGCLFSNYSRLLIPLMYAKNS